MTIYLYLQFRWFNAIKNGHKTVEGRLNKTKFMDLKIGEEIIFVCDFNKEELKTIVTNITIGDSFKQLYEKYGDKLLPTEYLTDEEKKDPSMIYDSISDYKQALQNGIKALGIEIKLIC